MTINQFGRSILLVALIAAGPACAQPGAATPMTAGEVAPPMSRVLPPAASDHFPADDGSRAPPAIVVAPPAESGNKCACSAPPRKQDVRPPAKSAARAACEC